MSESIRSCRRVIVALVVVSALALVSLALPQAASSVTRTGHDFTYYSTAAHTMPVGYCFVCIGYSGCHGQITPYYVIGPYPCNNG
ncbi:MAG TPA: hypothetical protein VIH93_00065 [Thermoanaerobaculia bacterium]|jgi:hypothetical protein